MLGSTWKHVQDRNQSPATCSQERKGENPCQGSCGELQRGEVCDSSGSCGKLQRGVENQLNGDRLDYHSMQISDYVYVDKVFENLRQKLRLSSCTLDVSFDILNVSTMRWIFTPWMRSTLCHDQVIKWAKAKKGTFLHRLCFFFGNG